MLSLSNVGYKDGRIGGLSCDVVGHEDVEFVELKGSFLQIEGKGTGSIYYQFIVSNIPDDI